ACALLPLLGLPNSNSPLPGQRAVQSNQTALRLLGFALGAGFLVLVAFQLNVKRRAAVGADQFLVGAEQRVLIDGGHGAAVGAGYLVQGVLIVLVLLVVAVQVGHEVVEVLVQRLELVVRLGQSVVMLGDG